MAAQKTPSTDQIAADKKIIAAVSAIVTSLRERYPSDLDLHGAERSLRSFAKIAPGPKPKPSAPPSTTPPAERPGFRDVAVEKTK